MISLMEIIVLGTAKPRTDRHKLAGTVTVDGLPAKRHVVVFDRLTYSVVATTISDQVSGEWEINGLPEYPERTLLVVALDDTGNYNAEVADYVSQVATA